MTLPHQSQLGWKILITLVHIISLSTTAVRVSHRWRIGRIWWDDYIVFIPWAFDFISVVVVWTKYINTDITWSIPNPRGFIYSDWFHAFVYFTVIWFSRISVTLSVAGIFLPGHRYRIYAFIFVIVLFTLYLTSIFITTFSCPGSPWWKLDYARCISTPSGASIAVIVGVTVDFAADAVLVAAPLFMFWKVDFPNQNERILILVLFASSIITMLASGLYCAIWYAAARIGPDSRLLFIMMGHLQATLALLVTNVLVVAMLVYRKFRGSGDSQDRSRRARPFDSDAGTATRERRRTGLNITGENMAHDSTVGPSYTFATIAPSTNSSAHASASASGQTSLSASISASAYTSYTSSSTRSSDPQSTSQLDSVQISSSRHNVPREADSSYQSRYIESFETESSS